MNKTNSFKIIIVGDSAVGKTSLINLYKSKEVSNFIPPTLGCEHHIITQRVDDEEMKLLIWDTAGQEKYKSLARTWYKQAKGVLIVFSVIDKNSYNNVRRWMDDLVNEIDNFSLIIVGNKSDLVEKRVVSFEQGEEMANEFNVPYFETCIYSEKMPQHGVEINEIFFELSKEILKKEKENQGDEEDRPSFKLGEVQQEDKKGCRC